MRVMRGWVPSPRAEQPDEDDRAVRRTDLTDLTDRHRTRLEGTTDHV